MQEKDLLINLLDTEKECPICFNKTKHYKTTRWNFHSQEKQDKNWKYYICQQCGCCFIDQMKKWTPTIFNKLIYNENYSKTDIGITGIRTNIFITPIIEIIKKYSNGEYILDYGGGLGTLIDLLRKNGYKNSYCFDPYGRQDISEDATNFDIVIAIEVLEHIFDAHTLWRTVSNKLKTGGIFIFSTHLCDEQNVEDWWYANPQAGHCILYSTFALINIAKWYNLEYVDTVTINSGMEYIYIFKKQNKGENK